MSVFDHVCLSVYIVHYMNDLRHDDNIVRKVNAMTKGLGVDMHSSV